MKNTLLFILLTVAHLVWGQSENNKIPIVILGTFHFSNPGLDVVKTEKTKNILSTEGQSEVESLLEKLEKYKPTKILVEVDIKKDSLLNSRYEKFIENKFELSESEIYQIGFKLAKQLNHSRIWAIDSPMWFAEDKDSLLFDDDYRSKYPAASRHDYNSFYEESDSLMVTLSLLDYLSYLNGKDNLSKSHQVYLTKYALVGAADNYVGANVVANWYKRNLMIYANICNITDCNKDERLLLIIGSGHGHLLNQFFDDSPDYTVIDIENILSQ